jgi:hypothetical protein
MSSSECDEFSGAGVLIIEVPKAGRELQLVLFRDKAKRAYADAGGKCEHVKHDNDPLKTAQEELYEESAGLLRVDERYLSGYVEKTVGKRGRWYRGYFLFTRELKRQDYLENVERLEEMDAPKYLQETDDMVRIPLSKLYRVLVVEHPNKKAPHVNLKREGKVKIHRRVAELLRIMFHDNPEWILKVMAASPFGVYKRKRDKDGLVRYVYS